MRQSAARAWIQAPRASASLSPRRALASRGGAGSRPAAQRALAATQAHAGVRSRAFVKSPADSRLQVACVSISALTEDLAPSCYRSWE